MAIKANGAALEWGGYEYARIFRGEIMETGDLDRLKKRKRLLNLVGEIMFRATYATDWIEVTDEQHS